MLKDLVGTKVPSVIFKARENNDWKDIESDKIFKNRKVVVFSLPGAFTPTCSSSHLPRYNQLASSFKAQGVDEVVCISVNDGFVMESWGKDQDAKNITLIPDGNGEFTEKIGMLVDKSAIGFGKRSWRYSMLVEDGVVTKSFIEPDKPGDPFEVSDADTMLNALAPNAEKPKSVAIISKIGCPYCLKAKNLLAEKGIVFDDIVVGRDIKATALFSLSGGHTVPQVFIDGKKIGGSEELETYFS